MKHRAILLAFLLAMLVAPLTTTLAAAAAEGSANEPGSRAAGETIATIATVQEIDHKTREITLRYPDGTLLTFVAGDVVRNLDQVKRGDVVLMEYYEGLVVTLVPQPLGITGRAVGLGASRAAKGEKPAGRVTSAVQVVAEVTAVDRKNRIVTLRGPERTVTLKVKDDIDLQRVKVGDQVAATYMTSLAVSVEPAPKVSGTVQIDSTAAAVGIGFQWGGGTLKMYDGSVHKFKVQGMSVIDIGVTSISMSGDVYNLKDPQDFAGNYVSGQAGGALVKGGAALIMKNERGVVMRLTSKQKGVRLTLGVEGITIGSVE